jgi:sortase A
MRRMRRSILVVATLIFTFGGVTTGVALVQICHMNNFQETLAIETSKLSAPKVVAPKYVPIKLGEPIGIISIPKLSEVYPIVQGTDASDLEKGVGHFVGSVMPGIKDNTVLAGHRDSVFSKLGKLVVGDLVTISTSDGTFIYSVTKTRIVLPTDKTVIVPTPNATLTLITCYPFYYIGSAPKRYIVSANLVNQ